MGGTSATTSASATASASPTQTSRSITLELHPLGDHTAHGTVVIDIQGDGYRMTVTVLGLLPNSRHLLNLHGGTCAHPFMVPEEARNLGDVQADASGKATFTTPHYPYPYNGGRILTVHNEPLKTLPGDTPVPPGHIACADLTN